MKTSICLTICCLLLWAFPANAQRSLTVWLLPVERGIGADVSDIRELEKEIEKFSTTEVPPRVTVENISDPVLRAQLLAWNPEFAMPNFGWLRGQSATLSALSHFAVTHDIEVRVRFNTWANAFSELNRAERERRLPDVAQVGSTWIANFGSRGMLRPCKRPDASGGWRDIDEMKCASLKYSVDVRLVFYWQRPPHSAVGPQRFVIDTSSWRSMLDSLQSAGGTPFAMPIGLTYNVMHDLFPLITDNPKDLFSFSQWTNGARVTRFPVDRLQLMADNAVYHDDRGYPRRIIAFPEVTHEEAIRSFENGGYIGLIEPIGYLTRWQENPDLVRHGDDFWQYAGVSAPPSGILGGSDLIVTRDTSDEDLAFELAQFLATDPDYTQTLARLGTLPAANTDAAIDVLAQAATGSAREDLIAQIGREIRLALRRSKEYPALPEWATEVESRFFLEACQQLWRRMAEAEPAKLQEAVDQLKDDINGRIDPVTKSMNWATAVWQEISLVLVLVMTGLVISFRHRSKLLTQLRKVRGFGFAGLLMLDSVHQRYNPFRGRDQAEDEKDAEKAALISVGLVGLQRGLQDENWRSQRLSEIAWRAVVLALDSVRDVDLSRRWQASAQTPEVFLGRENLLRASSHFTPGGAPFFFAVQIESDPVIALPFLMEQALTCLIQNALKASKATLPSGEGYYLPVTLEIAADGVTVKNLIANGKRVSPFVSELINESRSIAEFDERVRGLLEGPIEHRPGIGLVEAYCIAAQCYDNMRIAPEENRVSTTIHLKKTWSSWLRRAWGRAVSEVHSRFPALVMKGASR